MTTKDFPKFRVGDRVINAICGPGTVSDPPDYHHDTETWMWITGDDGRTVERLWDGRWSERAMYPDTWHAEPIIPPEPPRRPDLKVDDRVLVRDSDDATWVPRHFKEWADDGKVVCFSIGKTSWTTDEIDHTWNFYRLPEEGE